jgi:WXG100 family type VII secretion target
MAGFQTGTPHLVQIAKDMEDTNVQLMNNLKQLAGEVEAVETKWGGVAHDAFQRLMERFQTDAKSLNDNLLQIAEAVTGNAKAYDAQEAQAEASISAITNALG